MLQQNANNVHFNGLKAPRQAVSIRQSLDFQSFAEGACSPQCWITTNTLQKENQGLKEQYKTILNKNLSLNQYIDTINAQIRNYEHTLKEKNQTIQKLTNQLNEQANKYQKNYMIWIKEKEESKSKQGRMNMKRTISQNHQRQLRNLSNVKDLSIDKKESNFSQENLKFQTQQKGVKHKIQLRELQLQNMKLVGKLQIFEILVKKQQDELCKFISKFNTEIDQCIKIKTQQIQTKYKWVYEGKIEALKQQNEEKQKKKKQQEKQQEKQKEKIQDRENEKVTTNISKAQNKEISIKPINLFKEPANDIIFISSPNNKPPIKFNKTLFIRPKTYQQPNKYPHHQYMNSQTPSLKQCYNTHLNTTTVHETPIMTPRNPPSFKYSNGN